MIKVFQTPEMANLVWTKDAKSWVSKNIF